MNSMDRPIAPEQMRKERLQRLALPGALGITGILLIVLLVSWLQTSISRDEIRTAVVERGEVTATLDASGLVVPEFEHILTAPIATRVTQILKSPGSEVQPGEPIVTLDPSDAKLAMERLEEQIALKRNASKQAGIELARMRDDLQAQRDIAALELQSLEYEVERNNKMVERGLITRDELRRSETDLERTKIELKHLEAQLTNAEHDLAARLEGLGVEISILEKDLVRARERLDEMTASSDRAGIVTWVVASEGTTVAAGGAVAKVADLSAYRVEASLSDVLVRKLKVGLPAIVRSGDTRLAGTVQRILPTVEKGIVTFQVSLDEKSHSILRPNLRVDVHAVTEISTDALCLKRGPLLNVDGHDAVFVVRGDKLERTPVEIGLASFERYEIVSGLAEGDEVVISDMSDYRNSKEVELQ